MFCKQVIKRTNYILKVDVRKKRDEQYAVDLYDVGAWYCPLSYHMASSLSSGV